MSQTSEKFCEECGKTSPIEVKFCKFCGIEFPVIDHPAYIRANVPPYSASPQDFPANQQFQPPPSYTGQYPPYQSPMSPQGIHQPPVSVPLMRKPPRVWEGGGLVKACSRIFSNPVETAPGLTEDPQAPSSIWIIFLTAVSVALVQYFMYLKTNFTKQIGDDNEFFNTYASSQGIQNSALQIATFSFLLQFLSWFILSWLLALWVKGGLPQDSYLLHAPSKSMRQLSGFLYIPSLFKNIAQIILLQFEDDRDASIEKGDPILNTDTPDIKYLTSFSDEYNGILLVLTLIMAIITAVTLYRAIKIGLNHRGSSPAVIAILIVGFSLLFSPLY